MQHLQDVSDHRTALQMLKVSELRHVPGLLLCCQDNQETQTDTPNSRIHYCSKKICFPKLVKRYIIYLTIRTSV